MVTDVNWTYCGDHFAIYQILDHYIVHLRQISCSANYTSIKKYSSLLELYICAKPDFFQTSNKTTKPTDWRLKRMWESNYVRLDQTLKRVTKMYNNAILLTKFCFVKLQVFIKYAIYIHIMGYFKMNYVNP